jgi:hypothetical protein
MTFFDLIYRWRWTVIYLCVLAYLAYVAMVLDIAGAFR